MWTNIIRNATRRTGLILMLLAGTVNSSWGGGHCPFNFRMYTSDFEKIWYIRFILTSETVHWSLETCVRSNRSSFISSANRSSISIIDDSRRLGCYLLSTAKLLPKFPKTVVSPSLGSVSQSVKEQRHSVTSRETLIFLYTVVRTSSFANH
jgi:hypothetical protein